MKGNRPLYITLGMLFILTFIVSIAIGPAHISISDVFRILMGRIPILGGFVSPDVEGSAEVIVLLLRFPRAVQGALVGAALAVSGVVIQTLFRNPMADPFVVGISSGAALGASVAILFGLGGLFTLPILAFLGATAAAFTVYNLARRSSGLGVETLLLSGIAVAYFLSSITSFLLYTAGEALHQIIFWLMGGLWASSWTKVWVLLPAFLVFFSILYLFSRDLNAMLLGEEPAHHLGIDVENIKKLVLISASILTGIAVAFSGTIGFVGLIIPHVSRLLFGPDHRVLLPASAFTGAIFLVWSDTLARSIISPAEIPVGVVTSFFGAPFFIYLLRTRRRTI